MRHLLTIRDLMCGCPRHLWSKRLLVMLTAFVDDSRDNEDKVYFAAYVNTTDKWEQFESEWQAALDAPPKIDFFHMTEAASRTGAMHSAQFRAFTDQQRERKVLAMAKVIKKFAPWGYHVFVDARRYREIVSPYVPNPVADPYFALVFALVRGLTKFHSDIQVDDRCRFIFDKRDGLKQKVDPFFDILLDQSGDQPWNKLISGYPSFEDDKEFRPLQAADLLAWHIRRKGTGSYPPEFRFLNDMLTITDCHYCSEVDLKFMEAIAEGGRVLEINKTGLDSKKGWRTFLSAVEAKA